MNFIIIFPCQEFQIVEKKLKSSKMEIKELGEVAKIKGGKRIPLGETFSDKKTDYPYLRVTDFNQNSINLNNLKYISKEVFDKIKNYTISTKDIYISNAGTIGLVGIIPEELNNKSLTENAGKITNINIDKIEQKYLMYILDSKISKKQIDRELLVVGVPKLSLERISNLKIPIPPKEIQKQIVDLMDNAYNLKKQNEEKAKKMIDGIDDFVLEKLGIKMSEIKEKMCFIVYSNELENNRIDAEFHQKKYKMIEKALKNGKYELQKIKEIANLTTGAIIDTKSYVKEGVPLIRIQNISDDIFFKNLKYISENIFNKNKQAQLLAGDLVFGMSGTIGNVGVVQNNIEKCLLNQRIAILRNIKIDKYYLKNFLNNAIAKLQFERIGTGGIQINISSQDILNLKIPIPPLEIQKEIAKEVKSRLEKAKELKKSASENLQKAKEEVEKILLS